MAPLSERMYTTAKTKLFMCRFRTSLFILVNFLIFVKKCLSFNCIQLLIVFALQMHLGTQWRYGTCNKPISPEVSTEIKYPLRFSAVEIPCDIIFPALSSSGPT